MIVAACATPTRAHHRLVISLRLLIGEGSIRSAVGRRLANHHLLELLGRDGVRVLDLVVLLRLAWSAVLELLVMAVATGSQGLRSRAI